MEFITEARKVFQGEACKVIEREQVKKNDKNYDIGFNSFFKNGWKRFYLKWYRVEHPSVLDSCPRSFAILEKVKCIKSRMFVNALPEGRLNPHKILFAGSLRDDLVLRTPNSENCYIDADGLTCRWKDGEPVVFDETFVNEGRNDTGKTRPILFCDVTRSQKSRNLQFIADWLCNKIMSTAVSPNKSSDKTVFVNHASKIYCMVRNNKKNHKVWNKNIYSMTKSILFLGMAFYFIFYL